MTDRPKTEIASLAIPGEGDKLIAPSASRNLDAICDLLAHVAPRQGRALELASGTGQHVIAFASRLPGLHWQPTEIAAERRASISAYMADAAPDNISPVIDLDAAVAGWGTLQSGQALIVVINLLHLVSLPKVETLIREAAAALTPGGRFVIYGPFMRAGELTSDGDKSFHAGLTAQDPQTGYKDDFDMMDLLQDAGLDMVEVIEMPANNLALVAEKPGA